MKQVERLQKKPDRGLSEKPKKVGVEAAHAYYYDLMAYVAKSRDLSNIPVLIKAVEVGGDVVESLAGSGDAAAPALVAATRASEDAASITQGLRTMRLMVERKMMLSQASRSGISETVMARLQGRQASAVVMEAIAAAAVLDDPRVRKRLTEIAGAQSSTEIGLTFSDPDNALRIRPAAEAAVGATPEQQAMLNNFRSPDWFRRYDASRVILNTAASDRSPELNAAVLAELQRLQKSSSLGAELVPTTVQDRSMGMTYYRNLIDVASDAKTPAAIPVLVKAISFDDRVVRSLVRFEEAAVPPLVDGIRQGASAEDTQASLVSLRRIVDKRAEDLSTASRSAMVEVTLQCLKGQQQSSVVLRAIDLAQGLRDPRLNVRLTAIVEAASAKDADLALTDPESFARVQTAAKLALPKER